MKIWGGKSIYPSMINENMRSINFINEVHQFHEREPGRGRHPPHPPTRVHAGKLGQLTRTRLTHPIHACSFFFLPLVVLAPLPLHELEFAFADKHKKLLLRVFAVGS